jgi:hypothetical protein
VPMKDPEPDFNPLRMQHDHNIELRGFEHTGEVAEQLEREAQEQRHGFVPGGGTRWVRTEDPEQADEFRSGVRLLARLRGW